MLQILSWEQLAFVFSTDILSWSYLVIKLKCTMTSKFLKKCFLVKNAAINESISKGSNGHSLYSSVSTRVWTLF